MVWQIQKNSASNLDNLPIVLTVVGIVVHGFGSVEYLLPLAMSRLLFLTAVLILSTQARCVRMAILAFGAMLPLVFVNGVASSYSANPGSIYAFAQCMLVVVLAYQLAKRYGPGTLLERYNRYMMPFVYIGWVMLILELMGIHIYGALAQFSVNSNITFSGQVPRFRSVFPEPAHYFIAIAPLFVESVMEQMEGRWSLRNIATGLSLVATFSLSSYATAALILGYLLTRGNVARTKHIVLMLAVGAVAVAAFGSAIDARIEGLLEINTTSVGDNSSNVSALLANWYVAWENFVCSPLFGAGFMAHEATYYSYFRFHFAGIGLNVRDAASLYIRILSEFGLFGVLYFLGYVGHLYNDKSRWPYANLFLVTYLAVGMRYGSIDQVQTWLLLAFAAAHGSVPRAQAAEFPQRTRRRHCARVRRLASRAT